MSASERRRFQLVQRFEEHEDYDVYLPLGDGNEMHIRLTIDHDGVTDAPRTAYVCIIEETTSGGTYNEPAYGPNGYTEISISLAKAAELIQLAN